MLQPRFASRRLLVLAVAAALAQPGPAAAQLLGAPGGLVGGLPSLPAAGVPDTDLGAVRARLDQAALPPMSTALDLPGVVGAAGELTAAPLIQLRRLRASALIAGHPGLIEADPRGEPVVRGQVLAISPTPGALEAARRAGFAIRGESALEGLDLHLVTLAAPPGLSAAEAVERLRAMDPQGRYDFDHLYQPSGEARPGARGGKPPGPMPAAHARIGLIDGAVADRQPTFAGVKVVQAAFAGPPRATPHATAVASLLVGRRGAFKGAAAGASLYAADVYGNLPTGGSAASLARALAWMAQNRVPVVNISLVGPPNLTLEAAVRALVAKGHLVVAPVGNDGPAAPALYPASYPGVVAVTAVDRRKRLLPEAGRAAHVDFAAPGADMAAAAPDGGFVSVRGTSFAAPLAAGELARLMTWPDRAAAAQAVAALGRKAQDLGPRGHDRTFGAGLVAFELRTDPAAVAARSSAMRRR